MATTPEQTEAQKQAAEKLAARVAELEGFVGKTFAPNEPHPRYPNQTVKILKYIGIATLANGQSAHGFRAESKSPNMIWTPPATEFLANYHQVENEVETVHEVI